MKQNEYDAIVVGTGISGGWAAKELTERGLRVLLLDRGRNVEHPKDYITTNTPKWEFPHRGMVTREDRKMHPVQTRSYPYNEMRSHFWVDDLDCPYTEIKRFDWYRGYHVGGRSLLWGRQSYRWSPMDLAANGQDGHGVEWPIAYDELAPWYTHVERFAGISGTKENLPQLPDSVFLPAMELNCVEKDVKKRMEKAYNQRRKLIIGRVANLTKMHMDRGKCQYRNLCMRGCPFAGYFSSNSATIPAAMKTDRLTLRPHSIVHRIIYDEQTRKATGVSVVDAETNEVYEFKSKIVFLCASTLNSTFILLNTSTPEYPDGLGSSSNALGRNLMDHHFRCGASGEVDGFDDKYYYGHRPNGFYIPRYQNIGDDKRSYLRGFGYQGSASRSSWSRGVAELGIGKAFKERMTEPGKWSIGMTGFGEILPYSENRITLDKEKKDKWGLPVLAIDSELKENEKKMREDMKNDAAEMLESAGVKNINTYDAEYYMGMGIHEMGTARMGKSPKTSVLNKWNQVWDAKNVFVTDGACMTSSACQNPSLTYMALTARACAYAVQQLKEKKI